LLDAEPRHPKGLLERGRLELTAGDLPAAERWLREALAAQPGNYHTNYSLALCLQQQDKTQEATVHFARAEKIAADMKRLEAVSREALTHPRNPAPRVEAGQLCLKNGHDLEGLRWLHGALQIDPAFAPAHRVLAAYYEENGAKERAESHRLQAELAAP
jgi:Tfp pilus assembly protein PilF